MLTVQLLGVTSISEVFLYIKNVFNYSLIAACAAAKRAIGTRNGEQDT